MTGWHNRPSASLKQASSQGLSDFRTDQKSAQGRALGAAQLPEWFMQPTQRTAAAFPTTMTRPPPAFSASLYCHQFARGSGLPRRYRRSGIRRRPRRSGGAACSAPIGYSARVQARRRLLATLIWIARLYLWRSLLSWLPGGKRLRVYSINAMRARHPEWFREDLERLHAIRGRRAAPRPGEAAMTRISTRDSAGAGAGPHGRCGQRG